MSVGERIKRARISRGMSQKDLAESLGVSAQTISVYENNKRTPKYETIERFAKVLGVPVAELAEAQYNEIRSDLLSFIQSAKISINVSTDELENANTLSAVYDAIRREESTPPVQTGAVGKLYWAFNKLNRKGQAVAVERVRELTKIPEYQRKDSEDA